MSGRKEGRSKERRKRKEGKKKGTTERLTDKEKKKRKNYANECNEKIPRPILTYFLSVTLNVSENNLMK